MKKGMSIKEHMAQSRRANTALIAFSQADEESLSEAWGRFSDILGSLPHNQYNDSKLFQYFTRYLQSWTKELLRSLNVSRYEDVALAAALEQILDETISLGSLVVTACDPSEQVLVDFILANVSDAGTITGGVYVSHEITPEGHLVRLSTTDTPRVDCTNAEDTFSDMLRGIADAVLCAGPMSITAGDATERKFHDFVMRHISSAGSVDDGVYAYVEGDTIHFFPANESVELAETEHVAEADVQDQFGGDPTCIHTEIEDEDVEDGDGISIAVLPAFLVHDESTPIADTPGSDDVSMASDTWEEDAEHPAELTAPVQGESSTHYFSESVSISITYEDSDSDDVSHTLQDTCTFEQELYCDTSDEEIAEVYWDAPSIWEPDELELPEHLDDDNREMISEEKTESEELSGLKISRRSDAPYFLKGTGGHLEEMLGGALLEFVGGRGTQLLAEPRKVQIAQLDAPARILDPPFEKGVFYPVA